jgi:carbon-monoxide dehydrogenase large subunit
MERHVQPALAREVVRYVGEPVAVVVAEHRYTAEDAAAAVVVDIDPLDVVAGVGEADADRRPDELLCRVAARDGDVDTAFARADVVVDEAFAIQRHSAVPLETRGLVARWRDGGGLDLWGPTKFLAFTQGTVAAWFGLAAHDVACHRIDVGGMFGVRGELYPEDFLVPWAARLIGRPVRWVEDRREHFLATNHGREAVYRFRLAATRDGRLLAFRAEAAADLGAYARPAGARIPLLVVEELPGPYAWEAFEARCDGVRTNKTPVGTVRGPSALESTFVRERAIDVVATRLGLDPLELRRRNLISDGGEPFVRRFGEDVHAQTLEPADYRAMLERFVSHAGYEGRRAEVVRRRARGERVGLGIACFLAHSGLGREEHATVELTPGGELEVRTTATDVGQGLDAMCRRVVTETLAYDPDRVRVRSGATSGAPPGRGTFASRSAIFVANAVRNACVNLLDELRRTAAKRLGGDADAFDVRVDGVWDGRELVPWGELAPASADGLHRASEPAFGFGMHLAQVSLDPETLAPRVEHLAVGYDCGRPIDPEGVVGQLVGASVQAFGGTVLEELAYDDVGQPLAGTFMDYLLPTSAEAPPVDVILLGVPSRANPLGVKGAGEAGILGVAGAVANAVANAEARTDAAPARLPLGPGHLHRLLRTTARPREDA